MVSLKNNLLENHCLNFFSDLPYRKLILAYSGGIDSSVLLECILNIKDKLGICLLYTSPSPRDLSTSRMPSSA